MPFSLTLSALAMLSVRLIAADPLGLSVIVEPLRVKAPVVLPAVKVLPAPVASVVLPEEERVVKEAVDWTSVPIAVPLMPVAVVLKFPEVISKLLPPVLMLEAPNPERLRAPEVAVKFNAPVVWVKPLEAVRRPPAVIEPVPVVWM